jgi:hypothetical protein
VARLARGLLALSRDDMDDLMLCFQAIAGEPGAIHTLSERLAPLLRADAEGWLDALRWPEAVTPNATPTTDDLPGIYGPDD